MGHQQFISGGPFQILAPKGPSPERALEMRKIPRLTDFFANDQSRAEWKRFTFSTLFVTWSPAWRKSKSAIGRRWPANQRILFCFVCSRLAPSFTAEGWLSSGGFFQNEKGGQQLIPLRIHQNKRASPPPFGACYWRVRTSSFFCIGGFSDYFPALCNTRARWRSDWFFLLLTKTFFLCVSSLFNGHLIPAPGAKLPHFHNKKKKRSAVHWKCTRVSIHFYRFLSSLLCVQLSTNQVASFSFHPANGVYRVGLASCSQCWRPVGNWRANTGPIQ